MGDEILEMPPIARLLMKTEIPTVESTTTVLEVAKIMREKSLRNVFILKSGKPVGVLRDNDLATIVALQKDPAALTAEQVMDSSIPIVGLDTNVSDIAKLIAENDTRRVLVMDQGKMVGSITGRDLLYFIAFISRYAREWMKLQRTRTKPTEE